MTRYELIVPEASPSLNKFTYCRNPFVQAREKKRWGYLIRAAIGFLLVPKATGKRQLTIERHGKYPLDIDNLIGGAKCCITDNLRKFGLLVDDNQENVDIIGRNAKLMPKVKPYTVIILEDM